MKGASPFGEPTASRFILFIHGYNVDRRHADEAYDSFIGLLKKVTNQRFYGSICRFYWPGDLYKPWLLFLNPIASPLSYPFMISVARECGRKLGEYLSGRFPGGATIHIVAHSLGNRLLMEMVSSLAVGAGVVVSGSTLMAAAVPTRRVEPNGELYPIAQGRLGDSLVLHSRWDTILRDAFPFGEIPEQGIGWPEAIGLNGNPTGTFPLGKCMSQFAHGDYWTKAPSAAAAAIQLTYSVPRELSPNSPIEHGLPAENAPPSSHIDSRTIGR